MKRLSLNRRNKKVALQQSGSKMNFKRIISKPIIIIIIKPVSIISIIIKALLKEDKARANQRWCHRMKTTSKSKGPTYMDHLHILKQLKMQQELDNQSATCQKQIRSNDDVTRSSNPIHDE